MMMIAISKDDDDNDGDSAMGDKVDNDGACATGNGAMGYNNNDNDGGGMTGDEVDDYGEGTMGDNNDNDNNAQRDATIKSRQRRRWVATIVIGVQRRIETTTRMMTTTPARIALWECGRSIGGCQRSR